MRFKSTLILFVIAAFALAYFFVIEQPDHEQRVADEQSALRLFDADYNGVFGLTIGQPDTTLAFTRSGESWRMTEPTDDEADVASVNLVVMTIIRSEITERFDADTTKLGQYGLADPAVTLRLSDSLAVTLFTLDVGNFNITKSHCYARKRGSTEVLLVPTGLRRYALRTIFDFREKRITKIAAEDVTGIDISSADHTTSWTRVADDEWTTIVRGDTILGDATVIGAIPRELRAARALDILEGTEETLARYFNDPAGSIRLHLRDAEPVEFSFSKSDSQRCFVRSTASERVDALPVSSLDVFTRSLDDLRDRRALRFDRDSLAKVVLETDSLSLSVIRFGSEWSFANPTLGEIDQDAVNAMLEALGQLKFRDIVEERLRDPGEYDLISPEFRVTLFDAEQRLLDEVIAGPTQVPRRIRYATSHSSRHLAILDGEPLDEIARMFGQFRVQ